MAKNKKKDKEPSDAAEQAADTAPLATMKRKEYELSLIHI